MKTTTAPSQGPKPSTVKQRGLIRSLITAYHLNTSFVFEQNLYLQFTGLLMQRFTKSTFKDCENFIRYLETRDWYSFWVGTIINCAKLANILDPNETDIEKNCSDFNRWAEKKGAVKRPIEDFTYSEFSKVYLQLEKIIGVLEQKKLTDDLRAFLKEFNIKLPNNNK